MKQEEMNILVPQKLHEIEKEYNVTVLWAVESGSRAWGFASEDSDFDVRFIYKREPSAYLKLKADRDVIELPVDDTWDVNGWDLDKTLKLLNRSNPTLYEWMNSPVRYVETGFRQRIDPLLKTCFSEKKMLYHYLSTARRTIHNFLQKDQVVPKKYFYALRPLLACRWIMENHTEPPVLFRDLTETVLPDHMKPSVDRLLDLKLHGPEKMKIPPVAEIDFFLEEEILTAETYLNGLDESKESSWESLDSFFLQEIGMR